MSNALSIASVPYTKNNEWTPEFYTYHNGVTPQTALALQEIPKLHLTGTERILDIGCGNGDTARCIADTMLTTGSIHGIDVSQSMISHALHKHTTKNISFEHVSLFNFVPETKFDVAVCFWMLYPVEDYQYALHAIMNTIKPGGRVLITHILAPGTQYLRAYNAVVEPQKQAPTPASLTQVMSAVSQAGVNVEYLRVETEFASYTDLKKLKGSMEKIPVFHELTQEEQSAFDEKLNMTFSPCKDGSIHDNSQVICMVLKKKA